jgi:hypothetical protein
MVNPSSDHFGGDSSGQLRRHGTHLAKKLGKAGVAAFAGGAAGAAVAATMDDDEDTPVPERVEARPSTHPPDHSPTAVPVALEGATVRTSSLGDAPLEPTAQRSSGPDEEQPAARLFEAGGADHRWSGRREDEPPTNALPDGAPPRPSSAEGSAPPPAPIEPEWYDGEAVYPIYRPSEQTDDVA